MNLTERQRNLIRVVAVAITALVEIGFFPPNDLLRAIVDIALPITEFGLSTFFFTFRAWKLAHWVVYHVGIRPWFGLLYANEGGLFGEALLERTITVTTGKGILSLDAPRWRCQTYGSLGLIEARAELAFNKIKLHLLNRGAENVDIGKIEVQKIGGEKPDFYGNPSEFNEQTHEYRESDFPRKVRHGSLISFALHSDFPLLVKRSHLPHWPKRVYTILIIADVDRCVSFIHRGGNDVTARIDVDSPYVRYGIYSNKGKRFLGWKYGVERSDAKDRVLAIQAESERIHRFLMEPQHKKGFKLGLTDLGVPLRWASGGYLPVIRWRRPEDSAPRDWVALFYRTIRPYGLNVAIGASERDGELRNPTRMIEREFAEEFVVIDQDLGLDQSYGTGITKRTISQYKLRPSKAGGESDIAYLGHYARDYQEARRNHDNVRLSFARNSLFGVEQKDGSCYIDMVDHEEPSPVFLSVNPLELGIEAIWVCYAENMVDKKGRDIGELDEKAALIDGEIISPFDHTLVRQPVILLSVDYLKEIYESNRKTMGETAGRLGEVITDDPDRRECLVLGKLDKHTKKLKPNQDPPVGGIHIFSYDLASRNRRLQILKAKSRLSKREEDEARRIREWMKTHGNLLQAAVRQEQSGKPVVSEQLRTLCPATWKTLELAIHNGKI